MPKPLSEKSRVIREAINANPDLGNKELAELLNGSPERQQDRLKVSATDVARQKLVLKQAGQGAAEEGPEATGGKQSEPKARRRRPAQRRRKRQTPEPAAAAAREVAANGPDRGGPPAKPLELIDRLFDLATECGGFEALKRLVDRCAALEARGR
jgi:hypothetical protein